MILAAPQIQQPLKDGTTKALTSLLSGNSTLTTILQVFGGLVVGITVICLIARKWWPQFKIGQIMQGSGAFVGCVIGLILGIICISPTTFLPWLVFIIAFIPQVLLNIVGAIFGA